MKEVGSQWGKITLIRSHCMHNDTMLTMPHKITATTSKHNSWSCQLKIYTRWEIYPLNVPLYTHNLHVHVCCKQSKLHVHYLLLVSTKVTVIESNNYNTSFTCGLTRDIIIYQYINHSKQYNTTSVHVLHYNCPIGCTCVLREKSLLVLSVH